MSNSVDRLKAEYEKEIRSLDWQHMIETAKQNTERIYDVVVGRCLLGTVFSIMPSGKYYMPWACSNVTREEIENDQTFMEILEKVAEEYGGWIESGEGDPCDMFFTIPIETEEEDDDTCE